MVVLPSHWQSYTSPPDVVPGSKSQAGSEDTVISDGIPGVVGTSQDHTNLELVVLGSVK